MEKKNNRDQVILITGTSRGIGKHIAEHYCALNYTVIGCARSESSITHECYTHFVADVAAEDDLIEMFKSIRQRFKRLDVLINNAAINPAIISGALLPYSTIEKIYRVNVFAPMLCCRESVKLMLRNKFGRIVNIGSMAARHEVPGEALYTSTKAAMNAYTRVLAKEVGKIGITVNVLAPAAIRTELSSKINQTALAEVLSRNAIDDYGDFEDVTNSIDFLIRKESKHVTGQIVYLGGA